MAMTWEQLARVAPVTAGPIVRRRRQAAADAANPYSREGLLRQQEGLIGEGLDTGRRATAGYLDRAENFDASQALNEWAKGAYGTVSQQISDELKSLRGQAVGAGRLDTGFFDEDQGTVVNRNLANFNQALSQQALGAAGLDLRNAEGLGAFGERATENATDLLMSRREEVENAAREDEARKRRKRSGIGGFIGGALGAAGGFVLGGPAGAATGWKLGSSAGSSY